jgi:hypothetical protein
MVNAIQKEQFQHIVSTVEDQARERPPVTEREATRLTEIRRVAKQGLRIAEIEIKHKGLPEKAVPSATDYEAVHHETCVYEEDVEAELALRRTFEPFIKKGKSLLPFAGNALGGGGLLAMVLGLLRGNRKLKRSAIKKTVALGQAFKVLGENVEKDKLSKELEGTEAQEEYRERRNGGTRA